MGNGPFGIGWSLSHPSITRKTDKGLPQYRDSEDSDVFILSDAEDLVPVLTQNAFGDWINEETQCEGYCIRLYRPRGEGLFARIERWTRLADGDVYWRSISKDNIVTFYGLDSDSRICDPENASHIFSWLVCQSFDSTGNGIIYDHTSESDFGIDPCRANERNRQRTANGSHVSLFREVKRRAKTSIPRIENPGIPVSRSAPLCIHLAKPTPILFWQREVGRLHRGACNPLPSG